MRFVQSFFTLSLLLLSHIRVFWLQFGRYWPVCETRLSDNLELEFRIICRTNSTDRKRPPLTLGVRLCKFVLRCSPTFGVIFAGKRVVCLAGKTVSISSVKFDSQREISKLKAFWPVFCPRNLRTLTGIENTRVRVTGNDKIDRFSLLRHVSVYTSGIYRAVGILFVAKHTAYRWILKSLDKKIVPTLNIQCRPEKTTRRKNYFNTR